MSESVCVGVRRERGVAPEKRAVAINSKVS